MNKILKLTNLLMCAMALLTFSCSNDDDGAVVVNLQDLEVTIDENPSIGQVIGEVASSSSGSLTYSITAQTPSGALQINPSTGELSVANVALFDFETNPVITATVSATGVANVATVTVNINNIIETDAQDFTTAIDENPTNGDALGTVQATGDGTLSFSMISQNPAGAINIDASTGELTVADATVFDFETNPTITANISVDNSGSVESVVATIDLNDIHEIGEFKFGGIVFWVNATNDEGYVVSMNDQSPASPYGCMHTATGATGTSMGTGAANTAAILAVCSTTGTAADLTTNLNSNGFNDWFLPSQDEFNAIITNITVVNSSIIANGGSQVFGAYWTSTEINAAEARKYNPTNNWFPADLKSLGRPVRAVRAWTDF